MKFLLLGLSFALMLTGCSGGSGSGHNETPNGQVKSKIDEKAERTLTGQTALIEASQGIATNKSNKETPDNSVIFSAVSTNSDVHSKALVQEKTKLANKTIRPNVCTFNVEQLSNSATTGLASQITPFKLSITGSNCPVEINMEMTLTGVNNDKPCSQQQSLTVCNFTTNVKMNYRVRDQKLAEELEVQSGSINLAFNVEQTLPGNTQQSEQNMMIKTKATFDLKAIDLVGQVLLVTGSQDINMSMTMTTPSSGSNQMPVPQIFGSAKEDLRYLQESTNTSSSLSANVKFNGSSQPDEKYFVDGVSVTAEAYANERNKFANSMMAFDTNEQNENGNGNGSQPTPTPTTIIVPTPLPTATPIPFPTATPMPNPQPTATPFPMPTPENQNWACLIEDYSSHDIFIGYGANEFIATSNAKQTCSQLPQHQCSSYADCEEQKTNYDSWFCEIKNNKTNRIFNGSGRSKIEATYNARKYCLSASGKNADSCSKYSNCVNQ